MTSSLTLAQTAPAPAKAEDTGFFGSVGRWFDQQFNGAKDAVSNFGHEAGVAAKTDDPGFFGSVGRWFDQQVNGAKDMFGNLGREAGVAARTTADTAKDAAKGAADTLTSKQPATSVVYGHEV